MKKRRTRIKVELDKRYVATDGRGVEFQTTQHGTSLRIRTLLWDKDEPQQLNDILESSPELMIGLVNDYTGLLVSFDNIGK